MTTAKSTTLPGKTINYRRKHRYNFLFYQQPKIISSPLNNPKETPGSHILNWREQTQSMSPEGEKKNNKAVTNEIQNTTRNTT